MRWFFIPPSLLCLMKLIHAPRVCISSCGCVHRLSFARIIFQRVKDTVNKKCGNSNVWGGFSVETHEKDEVEAVKLICDCTSYVRRKCY